MKKCGRLLSFAAAGVIFAGSSLFASNEIMEPSGLDQIKEIITADEKLNQKVNSSDIANALRSIEKMNDLIREAIIVNGLANDGDISVADAREINRYLVANHLELWYELRGQKAGVDSTGYYIVDRKRLSNTIALNINAVSLWGAIYNLGFETDHKHRLVDSSGRKSASFKNVGYFLSEILKNEIESKKLYNDEFQEIEGTTGTAFDQVLKIIMTDKGLLKRIPTSDIRDGAQAANQMNHLIIEAIVENGLGNDGKLTTADIREINRYLVANHKEKWAELHGDDENGEETGYHLVQNDGAYSRMFADNVVNSVADGVYHLGFETNRKDRLLNEDGNANKRFEKVAWWLDTCLKEDLEAGRLSNPDFEEVKGTTGTIFDKIIPYIYNNEGLLLNVSMGDIREAARTANGMNELIVEAIKETGSAQDSYISVDEVKQINKYLVDNYESLWAELHGDDENGVETGYHLVQNDGARGDAYGKNVINRLADGIYHLGFYTPYKNRLANEDGNKNITFRSVAYWLNKSLKSDFENGVFKDSI
jgi:hypothetical protein